MRTLPQSSRIADPYSLMDLIHRYHNLFPRSTLLPLLHVPAPPPCCKTPLRPTTNLKDHVTSWGELDKGKHAPQQIRSCMQVVCQQTPHVFETRDIPLALCQTRLKMVHKLLRVRKGWVCSHIPALSSHTQVKKEI